MIKLFYGQTTDSARIYWAEQVDPLLAAHLMDSIETFSTLTVMGWTWSTHREYDHVMTIRGGRDFGFDFQAIAAPRGMVGAQPCAATIQRPGEYFHTPTRVVETGHRDEFYGTVTAALGFGLRPCPECFPTLAPVLTAVDQPEPTPLDPNQWVVVPPGESTYHERVPRWELTACGLDLTSPVRVPPSSRGDAVEHGYTPCPVCFPGATR